MKLVNKIGGVHLIGISGLHITIGAASDDVDAVIRPEIKILSPSEYYRARLNDGIKAEAIAVELRESALSDLVEECIVAGFRMNSAAAAEGHLALAESIDNAAFKKIFEIYFKEWLRIKDFRKLGNAVSYINQHHPDWAWLDEGDYVEILESNEFAKLSLRNEGSDIYPLLVNMGNFEKWDNPERVMKLFDRFIALAKTYDDDLLEIESFLNDLKLKISKNSGAGP